MDSETSGAKRRKISRACGGCRAKKLKCDRDESDDSSCSMCRAHGGICTLPEPQKNLKGRIEDVQERLDRVAALLKKWPDDSDISEQLRNALDMPALAPESGLSGMSDPIEVPSPRGYTVNPICEYPDAKVWKPRGTQHKMHLHAFSNVYASRGFASGPRGLLLDKEVYTIDDEPATEVIDEVDELAGNMEKFRFFGKSSGPVLIQHLLQMKQETSPGPGGIDDVVHRRDDGWKPPILKEKGPTHIYPPPDLMEDLIGLYWKHVHPYLPVLHRPTFERAYASNVHLHGEALSHESFGSVLLLVLANGARYSDDPRARLDPETQQSAGWAYLNQVQVLRVSILTVHTLWAIQTHALAAVFLMGSGSPHASWTMSGISLRLAQDLGIHRAKHRRPTVEDELWKRAFWVLIYVDRKSSIGVGRSPILLDEDFDQTLPIECDDEYWEDPYHPFEQPGGKPSTVTYFNLQLKLCQISTFAQQTIYSMNNAKARLGLVGLEFETQIVAECDSALNKWIDTIPEHLRWDPDRKDPTFLLQSVCLYGTYYHVQIFVHRPFITVSRLQGTLGFPSLAICRNAARATVKVYGLPQHQDTQFFWMQDHIAMFTAGLMLLVNIWVGIRSDAPLEIDALWDVRACLMFLRTHGKRWQFARTLGETLTSLASGKHSRLPLSLPDTTDGEEQPQAPSETSQFNPVFQHLQNPDSSEISPSTAPYTMPYTLPMYSNELGQAELDPSQQPQDSDNWYYDPAWSSTVGQNQLSQPVSEGGNWEWEMWDGTQPTNFSLWGGSFVSPDPNHSLEHWNLHNPTGAGVPYLWPSDGRR